MRVPKKIFTDFLKIKGLKSTAERHAVLEGAAAIGRHFSADELYEHLRGQGKLISRASVYRTLPLLIESGLVKESLSRQSTVGYEYMFGHDHHDHLICIACGRIIEFRDDSIERYQDLICEKNDFTSIDHELRIRGFCGKCR